MIEYVMIFFYIVFVIMFQEECKVIFVFLLGMVFEWYDFFFYGVLVVVISKQFFVGVNDIMVFIFVLMVFVVGFLVWFFGVLVFGCLGDMIGCKYIFLVIILLMGLLIFVVGLLFIYVLIGVVVLIILVILCMFQGLVLGGEYGGVVIYVVEYVLVNKCGSYISWIQFIVIFGLLFLLLVILVCCQLIGDEFEIWGWCLLFLLFIVLLGIFIWICLFMCELLVFFKMKVEGKVSKVLLCEFFIQWGNLKVVLIVLFSINVGQVVIFYMVQFYVLFFFIQVFKVDGGIVNGLLIVVLVFGVLFFIVVGWLFDCIGCKLVLLVGLLFVMLFYFLLFKGLIYYVNLVIDQVSWQLLISVVVDLVICIFQFDLVGKVIFDSFCDKVKIFLVKVGLFYLMVVVFVGSDVRVWIGEIEIVGFDVEVMVIVVKMVGYLQQVDGSQVNKLMVIVIIFVFVLIFIFCYGLLVVLMVELFLICICYFLLFLLYYIGNGWFGGFLFMVLFVLVVYIGDIFYGFWYLVLIIGGSLVCVLLFFCEICYIDIYW